MQRIQLYSGRVLHLPSATPHKIVNYYVQGTAREILVDGLLRWRQTKWGDYGIIVPVHDEILATVPAGEADEAMAALGQCMASELYGVRIGAEPKWINPSDRWLSNDHSLAKG
jgi:DNA polymerase-1